MKSHTHLAWPFLGIATSASLMVFGAPAWLSLLCAVALTGMPLWRAAGRRPPPLSAPRETETDWRRVAALLDALPDPVAFYDKEGQLLAGNGHFIAWLAAAGSAVLGVPRGDQMPPEREVRLVLAQAAPPRNYLISWQAVPLAERDDVRRVVVRDIHEVRETEHHLQLALARQVATAQGNEAFIQRLIDVIPEPVYLKDEHGVYIMINEAFARQRGQPREDIVWKTARALAPDGATADEIAREDGRVLAGEHVYKEDEAPHPATGAARVRIVTKGRCIDAEGRRVIVGANFDITGERMSKRALSERLEREQANHQRTMDFIQRIMNLVPFPLYVKDAQSRYRMVNDAMERDCGIPRARLIGSPGLPAEATPEQMFRLFEEDGAVLGGLKVYREEHGHHEFTGREYWRVLSKDVGVDSDGEQVIVGAHIDLTELRRVEQELRSALEREVQLRNRTLDFLQRLIDIIPDPVYIKKAGGRYVLVNEAFAAWHGRSVAEVMARQAVSSHPKASNALSLAEDVRVLAGDEVSKEEHTRNQFSGREAFRIVTKRRSVYFDGEPVVVGIDHHITQWRLAERESQALLQREVELRQRTMEFLARLIDVIPDPFYIKKAGGRYVMVNSAFADYYGLSRQEIIDQAGPLLVSPAESTGKSIGEDDKVLETGEELSFEEHTSRRLTGEEVFRIVTKRRSIYFDGEPVVVGFHHHVTRWRQAERELVRIATEDPLTGIANRHRFTEEATRQIALAHRTQRPLSLLMFDLDHFKAVNDNHGHQAGDEVLVETARRTVQVLRQSDLPGRWGGEEFVVLLPDSSLDAACAVADRVREHLSARPIACTHNLAAVTLSGGVAELQPGENLEQLIARADKALYRAKQEGRNRVLLADTSLRQRA